MHVTNSETRLPMQKGNCTNSLGGELGRSRGAGRESADKPGRSSDSHGVDAGGGCEHLPIRDLGVETKPMRAGLQRTVERKGEQERVRPTPTALKPRVHSNRVNSRHAVAIIASAIMSR